MERRTFLAATGIAASTFAGCLGGPGSSRTTETTTATTTETTTEATTTTTETTTTTTETTTTTAEPEVVGPKHSDDLPEDPSPNDGYPPEFQQVPEEREVDRMSFGYTVTRAREVTLVPIETIYYWYARGEGRFVDARGEAQYERSRIFGAVNSPAIVDDRTDDPTDGWAKDDRIICYCGCPHHLSSIRAAQLQSEGYTRVYVIDEGFGEWQNRNYPMAGSDVGGRPSLITVPGATNPDYAGEYALAIHPRTGQQEAAPIGPDGRFQLHLRFAGVGASSRLVVETPGYEVDAPLGDLADGLLLEGKP